MLYTVAVCVGLVVPTGTFPNASVELLPFRYTRLLLFPAPMFAMTKLCPPAEIAKALGEDKVVLSKANSHGVVPLVGPQRP